MKELIGEVVWRSFSTNPDYVVLTCEGLFKVLQEDTESDFDVGELIRVKGVLKDGEVFAEGVEALESELEESEGKKIERFLDGKCKALDFDLLAEDEVLEKLVKPIKHAASLVKREVMRCTPVINRFHNDPDGVASGLLFKKAVLDYAKENNPFYEEKWVESRQADSAIFEVKNVDEDIETASNFHKPPLLCLLDHGANQESEHAIMKAKANKFKILVVDHHPYSERVKEASDAFVSAREHGGGASHCGGLLAYHLALALSGKAEKRLAEMAMEGDKSTFYKGHLHDTLAVDYLASKPGRLEEYEGLLADGSKIESYYRKALASIKKAGEIAQKNTTVVKAGRGQVNLVALKELKQMKYPAKGTAVQEVHKHFEGKDFPVVTIGFDDERCIFRVNASAKFKANAFIDGIRKEFGEATPSGGGHEKAASLRMQAEKGKAVLEKVVEEAVKELQGE